MHHPPPLPPSRARTPRGFGGPRWRSITGLVLVGLALAVFLGNSAVVVFDMVEDTVGTGAGGDAYRDLANTVGLLALVAAPLLLFTGAACVLVNPRMPPGSLPAWTTTDDLRTARSLVLRGGPGGDARADEVAWALSGVVIGGNPLLVPQLRAAMLVVSGAAGGLLVANGFHLVVRGISESDLNGLALGVYSIVFFGGLLCVNLHAAVRDAGARAFRERYRAPHGAPRGQVLR